MTIFKERDVLNVLIVFIMMSVLIVGSIIIEFNVLDLLYLFCLDIFFVKYIIIKKGK